MRTAVVLFNLGGPLGPKDVKGFLYNLFKDPYIIALPWGLRHGVAGMIAHRRAPLAQKNYAHMGGGSPILKETRAQADALQARFGDDTRVFTGMRYWHPFIEETVAEIEAWGAERIVLLPLYPQFSSTTTLSAFDAFLAAYKGKADIVRVCCYSDNAHFVAAHADAVQAALSKVGNPKAYRLLFSAHGLPKKIIDRGDPYQEQVESSVSAIMRRIGDHDHVVCYQSRVGPLQWIGPSTDDTIRQAGRDGKSVILVPVAFVSEHIETLVELDIEYRHLAKESGVVDYVRVPALGTAPGFISALADEVRKALDGIQGVVGDHDCAACHTFCPKRRAA